MKHLHILSFSLVTIILGILLSSQYCAALGPEISSSSVTPSTGAPRPPGPSSEQRISFNAYIRLLHPERIKGLERHDPDDFNEMYRDVPFYDYAPLFRTSTQLSVVEQALRDYRKVTVVGDRDAQTLVYDERNGQIRHYPKDIRAVRLRFEVDPKIHTLYKTVHNFPLEVVPGRKSIQDVPYADDLPILTSGRDDLAHMMEAIDTRGAFYHVRPDTNDIQHDIHLIELPEQGELQIKKAGQRRVTQIQDTLTHFNTATRNLGRNVAAVLYGKPIIPNASLRQSRLERIQLSQYPRFTEHTTYRNIVNALQNHGKFRLYVTGEDGRMKKYKIKVDNLDENAAFKIKAERFGIRDKLEEGVLSALGKIRLPG
ncbi:uncharacterized protein MEPE_03949 [Melanopsichium pennsylvanicum]|uniref:Uncharacterized protein n=2 Tax=Melanopsichium pennsylvanicum TaxID=63383 RepID=A0AAJ4XN03_9BASI|nr:uncharacterized protein BN887_00268 [Melanopsichium pennsylvanicum 4]SNX85240.1 uncharacterized protein MEPE_03949 [Melanopsichium pennsylvanicum]